VEAGEGGVFDCDGELLAKVKQGLKSTSFLGLNRHG